MTWIVGAVSPFGHALAISDARVTFGDGSEVDLIQKSYCVGQYIVAGFSGSVRIGFSLLAHLHRQLHLDDPLQSWQPNSVARAWSKQAAAIYASHDEREKRLGCSVLIAGVSPIENNDEAPFPKTYLMRLTSPGFVPGFSRRGIAALQIGNGGRVKEYRDRVRLYFRDPRFVANLANWGADGLGQTLAFSLGSTIEEFPTPGVSPHLHIVACSRGQLYQGSNDHRTERNGIFYEHRMPRVATSYEEFSALAAEQNRSAAEAAA